MSEELLIITTLGPEAPEKLLMPFITANAALALDIKVTMFLMSSAVELAVKGAAAKIPTLDQMPTLPTLMESVVSQGGDFLLCGPCSNHRNIKPEDLIEHASIGGAAGLVNHIMGKKVVSF